MLAQPAGANLSENPGESWTEAMRRGDFDAAWRVSDRVLAARDPGTRDDPCQPYHLRWVWDGRPFDGRSVLVRCYHGLGDTLQFSRYLAPLRRRTAALTLEVQPELIPLLSLLDGPDRIIPFDPAAPYPPSQCDFEIMELGHALRIAPDPAPYLPILRSARDGPLRAGVCWQAKAGWSPERSLPPALLDPLSDIGGLTLYSLQRDAPVAGAVAECPTTMLKTARLIADLDLVISVDTMVAHLAGALGTPVWLLLTAQPDWRWLAGGRSSPWYPGIRKYRQTRAGEWHTPVAEIVGDLTRAVAAGTLRM